MLKALVFLDIDGTLLDENYSCNDKTVIPQIQKMQNNGVVFCLNSNRSLEDLLPVAKQFQIDGLIIGENGIFAYDSREKVTEYLVTTSHLAQFTKTKRLCETFIKDALEALYPDSHVSWQDVDTVSSLSHQSQFRDRKDGDIVALNNIYRRYTNSVHVLRWNRTKLEALRPNELQKILSYAKEKVPDSEKVEFAFSEIFSNILTYPTEATKQRAVKKILRNSLYRTKNVYVIGDEINDYNMAHGVGEFYTVGNAPDAVKNVALYSAEKPYAQGVTSLLERIDAKLS